MLHALNPSIRICGTVEEMAGNKKDERRGGRNDKKS
jgi:hypothetical protein